MASKESIAPQVDKGVFMVIVEKKNGEWEKARDFDINNPAPDVLKVHYFFEDQKARKTQRYKHKFTIHRRVSQR